MGPVVKLRRVSVREEVRRWTGDPILATAHRHTWLVRLETEAGHVADGEIAWLPRHGPMPDIAAVVAAWARGHLGRPLPDPMQDPGLSAPVAWAITAALTSLHGRWPAAEAIPENGLLHADSGTPAEVGRLWSQTVAAHPNIHTWKVKVGRQSFAEDLARLKCLKLPPGHRLRLDPNRKWGHLDPQAVADALADLPIDYIEEPVGWPELGRWARAGVPCAADESVATVPLSTLADAGVCAVVVKPSSVGSMGAVTALFDSAVARGLQVVVSSALEGPLGRVHLEGMVRTLAPPRPAAGLARATLHDMPIALTTVLDCAADDDPLQAAAARHPHAVALAGAHSQLTFAEWDQQASALADWLGDQTGARLAVEIDDPQGAVKFLAILRAGAIACLVPPESGDSRAAVRAVGLSPWQAGTGQPPGIRAARPATLLWSSGSRGTPRAIAHSVGQHMASAAASHAHTAFDCGDRWVAALRMHHVGGLALLFRALHAGGTVVFQHDRPLPALHPTHLSWVPTQLVRADHPPPPSLRHLLLGGAAAPPGLVQRARAAGWPVKTTYGSTELASQVCTSTTTGAADESGAPLAGRAVRADPHIRVRGSTTCLGVWRDGGIVPITDEQGWYATGDLGRITDTGTLVVQGRSDTMFISGGENVFPESIERVLGEHPQVQRVVVVDVPDATWGARPWAFIDGELSLEAARAHLSARLPRHAWVDRVLPWEDAGVGTTGKPRRAWFRARARGLTSPGAGSS